MRYIWITLTALAFLTVGCSGQSNNTTGNNQHQNTQNTQNVQKKKGLSDYYSVEVHPEGKNIVIAIFNRKLKVNNDDTWAAALLGGFEVANQSASGNDALAVGFSYTSGNVEAYAVSAADYRAFKSKKLSQEAFVNKIKRIK